MKAFRRHWAGWFKETPWLRAPNPLHLPLPQRPQNHTPPRKWRPHTGRCGAVLGARLSPAPSSLRGNGRYGPWSCSSAAASRPSRFLGESSESSRSTAPRSLRNHCPVPGSEQEPAGRARAPTPFGWRSPPSPFSPRQQPRHSALGAAGRSRPPRPALLETSRPYAASRSSNWHCDVNTTSNNAGPDLARDFLI